MSPHNLQTKTSQERYQDSEGHLKVSLNITQCHMLEAQDTPLFQPLTPPRVVTPGLCQGLKPSTALNLIRHLIRPRLIFKSVSDKLANMFKNTPVPQIA